VKVVATGVFFFSFRVNVPGVTAGLVAPAMARLAGAKVPAFAPPGVRLRLMVRPPATTTARLPYWSSSPTYHLRCPLGPTTSVPVVQASMRPAESFVQCSRDAARGATVTALETPVRVGSPSATVIVTVWAMKRVTLTVARPPALKLALVG
jgi:hypothetical protein